MGLTKKWLYFSSGKRKQELGYSLRVCRHCGCFVAAGTEQLEWKLAYGLNAGKEKVMRKRFELSANGGTTFKKLIEGHRTEKLK